MTPSVPRRAIGAAAQAVLDALLPPRCAATDVIIREGELSPAAEETLEPAPATSGAAWLYGGALQQALVRAKFEPNEGRARALGRRWARALADGEVPSPLANGQSADALTFVPAPWSRRLERGFDLPGVLAEAVAAPLGLPLLDLLICTRRDPPLSSGLAPKERQEAVRGRYRVRPGATLPAGPVLLIDDVITTGATLGAAAEPLEAAGLKVVKGALALTPRPGSLVPQDHLVTC